MTEIEDFRHSTEIAEKLFRLSRTVPDTADRKTETAEEADIKAFAGYIRSMVGKTAAPQNITMGNNGAIILAPSQTVSSIRLRNLPHFCGVTIFHVKGTLKILYTATSSAIARTTT